MPYRNVYEEQNARRSINSSGSEPERDPKKIAAIYASQLPSNEEFEKRRLQLLRELERRENAQCLDRKITGGILDR